MLLGVDPGTRTSGMVLFVERTGRVAYAEAKVDNEVVLRRLRRYELWDGGGWVSAPGAAHAAAECPTVIIEALSPRGQVVGWDTFTTIMWVGRMYEAAMFWTNVHLIHRDEVKKELLGRTNLPAADSHIMHYLLDTIGPKGKKASPGPTYGVAGHAWQALGAVQCYRQRGRA